MLAVATSRFQASAVFELLQQPIVARRFGIGDAELAAIHAWIRDAGIRWGIDGRHRAELGLPAIGRHSFSDGLDRLFLGYALPASAAVPLNERLAAGNPEGSAALALGSFREFVRQLERAARRARATRRRRTNGGRRCSACIDNFVAPAGDEIDDERETAAAHPRAPRQHDARRDERAAAAWTSSAPRSQALLDDPTRGGIPGGAVTFAAMASLRHLPYRFVCAIGLNDGAFPSTQRPAEFDLMAHDPRRGDRQRRSDERNVFLDLLLAARERLYLSYTGPQRARQLADPAVGPGRRAARLRRRGDRRGAVLAGFAADGARSGSSSRIRCSRSRSTTSSRTPIRAAAASTTNIARR